MLLAVSLDLELYGSFGAALGVGIALTLRHGAQYMLKRSSLGREILFRPVRNRTNAKMFYGLYLVALVNALVSLFDADFSARIASGLSLILIGSAGAGWSMYYLGRSFTEEIEIREGFSYVRSGPYAILNHPMRVSLAVEMAGLSIIAFNPLACLILMAFLGLMILRNQDEKLMLDMFLADPLGQRVNEPARENNLNH